MTEALATTDPLPAQGLPSKGPLLALRAAILARLTGDEALAALMGGRVRLHDEPPRGAAPVYALFGDASARDDSVDGAARHLHEAGLAVIGRPGSARSALEAAERIAALLHGLSNDLPEDGPSRRGGHALVRLRVARVAASRDERTGESRATLAIEAVTEAVPD